MSVHFPKSVEDAMTMLDSRIPLTASERKMIVQGLYDLGRHAGYESAQRQLHEYMQRAANRLGTTLEVTEGVKEYREPTDVIRERLASLRTTDNFTAPYPER